MKATSSCDKMEHYFLIFLSEKIKISSSDCLHLKEIFFSIIPISYLKQSTTVKKYQTNLNNFQNKFKQLISGEHQKENHLQSVSQIKEHALIQGIKENCTWLEIFENKLKMDMKLYMREEPLSFYQIWILYLLYKICKRFNLKNMILLRCASILLRRFPSKEIKIMVEKFERSKLTNKYQEFQEKVQMLQEDKQKISKIYYSYQKILLQCLFEEYSINYLIDTLKLDEIELKNDYLMKLETQEWLNFLMLKQNGNKKKQFLQESWRQNKNYQAFNKEDKGIYEKKYKFCNSRLYNIEQKYKENEIDKAFTNKYEIILLKGIINIEKWPNTKQKISEIYFGSKEISENAKNTKSQINQNNKALTTKGHFVRQTRSTIQKMTQIPQLEKKMFHIKNEQSDYSNSQIDQVSFSKESQEFSSILPNQLNFSPSSQKHPRWPQHLQWKLFLLYLTYGLNDPLITRLIPKKKKNDIQIYFEQHKQQILSKYQQIFDKKQYKRFRSTSSHQKEMLKILINDTKTCESKENSINSSQTNQSKIKFSFDQSRSERSFSSKESNQSKDQALEETNTIKDKKNQIKRMKEMRIKQRKVNKIIKCLNTPTESDKTKTERKAQAEKKQQKELLKEEFRRNFQKQEEQFKSALFDEEIIQNKYNWTIAEQVLISLICYNYTAAYSLISVFFNKNQEKIKDYIKEHQDQIVEISRLILQYYFEHGEEIDKIVNTKIKFVLKWIFQDQIPKRKVSQCFDQLNYPKIHTGKLNTLEEQKQKNYFDTKSSINSLQQLEKDSFKEQIHKISKMYFSQ